jgi:tetratricopeptide (TPR) repeat protein
VRVEVRIPGSVDAFVVDLRGDRHPPTPEIWQEVYLSALLRSILYADDANFRLAGYRKLDPIAGPEAEHRFLRAAENLFFKGWQLGSEPEIQVATVVSNHLANGVLKYFGDAGRYEQAVNLFEKLYAREPVVAALVAQAYLGMNEEIKAVQIMHAAIKETPHSYALLHVQADFLKSKGKADWALKLCKQAVNCAPSEFVTWAKLTECYIDVGDWESVSRRVGGNDLDR